MHISAYSTIYQHLPSQSLQFNFPVLNARLVHSMKMCVLCYKISGAIYIHVFMHIDVLGSIAVVAIQLKPS